jgi:oligoendopeptidase F
MHNDENKLPHWDMSVVFPDLDSAEFEADFQAVKEAVEGLAARFGMDIRSADFWRSGLDVIRADIDRFETAVNAQ